MSKVFLELLNISIMTGWVVLVVLLLRVLLKKAPAWVRCALWGIVGLRLVWPFHISSPVSLIPSRHTLPYGQLYDYTPELNTGIDVLDEVINPGFTQAFESEIANSVNPLQVWLELAGWVWLLGMVVMAVYAAVSFLRLRRRVAVSMPLEGQVYLCDRLDSPFILGLLRPRIYLPSGCEEAQKAHILAHENCHLARKDHWWKPLGFALLTVHWFNPLLWLAYILLCRDMELACDERVIRQMTPQEKKAYSEVLLRYSISKAGIGACPLAFGEVGVKQRIKAVLDYKKPVLWIVIAAIVVCAIAAVCLLTEPSIIPEMYFPTGSTSIPEEYLGVSTFKGLEVYVWDDDGQLWCGVLPGTNRTKSEEEIEALTLVSLDTMKYILDTYDMPDSNISVSLYGESLYWNTGAHYNGLDAIRMEIDRRLGITRCYLVRDTGDLFESSNAGILKITINGAECEYQLTAQNGANYTKDSWLMHLEVYRNYTIRFWRIYSVAEDPDNNILVLVDNEGNETVYEKQGR